ncbi:hypothetical protein [Streptomyces sp. NBC_01803]|uniref:hypothetical protein n=1 Tax=Streptomyces sp. NBC_01803 TaxID=2975946 RepID=UPI002DDA7531|nr:hypothetical protein [Streptomyces sp. NBC_01803]WSA44759.1 hypothetical protein OIE51_11415 [Streptomyces sp. NBC_01803]
MSTWITPRRAAAATAATAAIVALLAGGPPAAAADEAPAAFTIDDPRVIESSGLQASERHPGVYWTHNDSEDAAAIYAVDSATGETVATVTLSGITARDIEAISLGPDGDLYIGDIGDNFDGGWSEVWIYRIPEPERLADTAVTPTVHTVQYEDGPRDAEALMVHPVTGRVYIASKKQDGSGALYAGPEELSGTAPNVFARVADTDLWVTDGAFSPDGTRLLLRGYFTAQMYEWRADEPAELARRVIPPSQLQGESVTFTRDGRTLMFGSEGQGSEVEPVELRGELLPESAAEAEAAEEEAEEEASGEPAPGEGGDEGNTDDDGDGGGLSSPVLMALAVGAVVVFGVRRVMSGGGGGKDG